MLIEPVFTVHVGCVNVVVAAAGAPGGLFKVTTFVDEHPEAFLTVSV